MESFTAIFISLFTTMEGLINVLVHGIHIMRTLINQSPDWLTWVLVGGLVLTGLWLIWQGLARESRLSRPEALELNPENPEHLAGRQEDLQILVNAVKSNPLVFLEGESGVGKTALVRAGLIPTLNQPEAHLLPIYLNCYGSDWNQGLRDRLIIAIWQVLATRLQTKLHIDSPQLLQQHLLDECGTGRFIKRLSQELELHLLLIFDQFDYYLATHHKQFLNEGCWLPASALIAKNEFWCGIHGGLTNNSLHCLFVIRRKWAMGLEAVRFITPVQLSLAPVRASAIASLITQLTTSIVTTSMDTDSDVNTNNVASPVVVNPDAGWVALKDLLVEDLTSGGCILPIQARIALQGLRVLPDLSIRAYEAASGLEGIEVNYVQNVVNAAAAGAKIKSMQVQQVLAAMVDETIPMLPKAHFISAAKIFDSAQIDADRGQHLLTILTNNGLVKPKSVALVDQDDCAWTLNHDYLARIILHIRQHSNKWQRLLQARHHTFRTVKGLPVKWRTLLSPSEQLRLLFATIHGQVNWRGYRSFGFFSTLRIIPFLIVLWLITTSTDKWLNWQAYNTADLLLQRLSYNQIADARPDGEFLRQLWVVAAAGPRLKRIFVERSLEATKAHAQLLARLDIVTQAIVGLDPQYEIRKQILVMTVPKIAAGTTNAQQQVSPYQALLAAAVYATDTKKFANFSNAIANYINMAMYARNGENTLSALGMALYGLKQHLTPLQIQIGIERLIEAIKNSRDTWQVVKLAKVLQGFAENLSQSQAQQVTERIAAVMLGTNNRRLLAELGYILGSFRQNLPSMPIESAAKRLIAVMGSGTDQDQMDNLSQALDSISAQLPPPQVQAIAELLSEAMRTSKDHAQLTHLGNILGRLAARLPQSQLVVEKLVEGILDSHDLAQVKLLVWALAQLGERLDFAQLRVVTSYLLLVMDTTTNPDDLAALGTVLSNLLKLPKYWDSNLQATYTALGTQHIVEVMEACVVPQHLAELATTLASFAPELSPPQITAATIKLVTAMQLSDAPGQLVKLGQALADFGEQLPTNVAQVGVERLLDVIDAGVDSEQLLQLGAILKLLQSKSPNWGGGLNTKDNMLAESLTRLITSIGNSTDREHLLGYGKISAPLLAQSTADIAPAIGKQIVELMGTTTEYDNLLVLAQALRVLLSSHVTNGNHVDLIELAKTAAASLLAALKTDTNWEHLAALGQEFVLLVNIIYTQDTTITVIINNGTERLISAMRASTVPKQLAVLAAVLGQLGAKSSPSHLQIGAERLIAVMRTNTNSTQLQTLQLELQRLVSLLPAHITQAMIDQLLAALQAGGGAQQVLLFGRVLMSLADRMTTPQVLAVAERSVEMMRISNDISTLAALAEILRGFRPQPALLQAAVEHLVVAMHNSSDWEQLLTLNRAVLNLTSVDTDGVTTITQSRAAERLLEVLQATTANTPPELAAEILDNVHTLLTKPQATALIARLSEATCANGDWQQLLILGQTINKMVDKITPTQLQRSAECFVAEMLNSANAEAFVQMAAVLGQLRIAASPHLIPQVLDLLKTPLAVGATKEHILAFISGLAGVKFNSSNDFIAWSHVNLLLENLSRPPRSPFQ